ncbi:UDP-2-acetamido-2,6-beta-L-arabino-hexul-4-ose reductase [Accumulibacter sp.]|uniref:UDP-2-acetamido-2,6-beta-L-arabino-hexul-4-ose reductase n=1 Tax=Accumulibacter sp. TaxID=2053492 RepID=UPI0028C42E67|nr:NAD-dependent epimerase/dehydratase family protein [Accumulibacter sp.]
MKVLVTGSNGFIGKNLMVRLGELAAFEAIEFDRQDSLADLAERVTRSDAIVHLAGVNRPKNVEEFAAGNADLTGQLCDLIAATNRKIPLIISSSTQAALANPYGESKRAAEVAGELLAEKTGNPVVVYRLPNVFGKWCRPNYNSVVATFCHNVANDLPIEIRAPAAALELVYVDDLVAQFIDTLCAAPAGVSRGVVSPVYGITLGDLAEQIGAFRNCRDSLVSERVGTGLVRALYATYVTYLPLAKLAYDLPKHGDERGVFVEMLKTKDSGQFSFFTAHPGTTRGGHYHHTKTEKFLVVKGSARFGFRHVVTDEQYEVLTSGDKPQVVETVPGWAHDITNVGVDDMVVMLWANEIFDRTRSDTIAAKV